MKGEIRLRGIRGAITVEKNDSVEEIASNLEKLYFEGDGSAGEKNKLEGKNHALKLVKSINSSEHARLFVAGFKTLEYDLAMEGTNAIEMAKEVIDFLK